MHRRTRLTALAIATTALTAPLSLSAQDLQWDGHFHGGDFSIAAGVGATFGLANGLAVYPSIEWTIADINPGVPLAFGASARGYLSIVQYLGTSYSSFGGGGFAIAHLGMDLDVLPDFLRNMDFYIGLGVAFNIIPSGFYTTGGLGFATFEGVNYFISESFAVYLEYVYWSYTSAGTIGVLLKL